jgi:molecular chaperone GrpE
MNEEQEKTNQATGGQGGDRTTASQQTAEAKSEVTGAPDATATESLEAQLSKAQAQAAEYLDNWRRSTAELSNARKRMQREQADFQANAAARVLTRLLPIIDDMDRAFEALPAEEADQEWVTGFRLIQRKLQTILESEGAMPIPTEGQRFDPQLHHAVSHEDYPGMAEGDIIGEVGRGYKIGDRVLRPALVRVAKG